MNGWKKGAGQREPVAPGTFSLFDPLQAGLGAAAVGQANRAALYALANGMKYRSTKLMFRSMMQSSKLLGELSFVVPVVMADAALIDAIHTELTQPCTVP